MDWIGDRRDGDIRSQEGARPVGHRRERTFEVLKDLATGQLSDFDETVAIDIGRRLAASWILGGGYQRIGEMIRITARVIDVNTGEVVRTVKIDGNIKRFSTCRTR